jgi:hypothetical protein
MNPIDGVLCLRVPVSILAALCLGGCALLAGIEDGVLTPPDGSASSGGGSSAGSGGGASTSTGGSGTGAAGGAAAMGYAAAVLADDPIQSAR